MKTIALVLRAFGIVVAVSLSTTNALAAALTIPAYSPITVSFPCAKQVLESSASADRVSVIFSDPQAVDCRGDLHALTPLLPPGSYTVTVRSASGVVGVGTPIAVVVDPAPPTIPVFALFHQPTNTFFVTASQSDQSALLAQGWQTADAGFTVWPVISSPRPLPTTTPVCRFFVPAKATHFYSGNPTDCEALKTVAGFVDEGIVFRAIQPFGGVCGPGTRPVYRLFDPVRTNHRYTAAVDTASAMVTSAINPNVNELPSIRSTWINEGIAFCSPIQ